MFTKINRLLDRVESRIALWNAIGAGSFVVSAGGITGWLSAGIAWIDQFGLFGWWLASLGGSLVAAVLLVLLAVFRVNLAKARAIAHWREKVDVINPLDDEFNRKRIALSDLVDPITNSIQNKKIINCDLFGPVNIYISHHVDFTRTEIIDCDFIALKEPTNPYKISNAVSMAHVSIFGCRLHKCTFLVDPGIVSYLQKAIAVDFVTVTPDELRKAQER